MTGAADILQAGAAEIAETLKNPRFFIERSPGKRYDSRKNKDVHRKGRPALFDGRFFNFSKGMRGYEGMRGTGADSVGMRDFRGDLPGGAAALPATGSILSTGTFSRFICSMRTTPAAGSARHA